ncbi:hypothetical protein HUU59_07110 [bacterium]|nr:hypothetical protein [bacterium]
MPEQNTHEPLGPALALVEVLIHELANPVQAARTAMNLWHTENVDRDRQDRLHGIETALDRVAAVIKTVQAVKESSCLPPTSVSSDKLRSDIASECADAKVTLHIDDWPSSQVALKMHPVVLPVLIANWASISRDRGNCLHIALRPKGDRWLLQATLRKGDRDSITKHGLASEVAGYPAAIGEFMIAAGGAAEVMEDSLGSFELDIDIAAWSREEKIENDEIYS